MNHRNVSLIDNLGFAANRTEIYNLRGMDPISELVIYLRGTNNAAVPLGHPAHMLTRVQVVDGSEVIVDLTGEQCVALGYYHYGVMPPSMCVYVNTLTFGQCFRIPFGRWLWDQELALDPARFKNLQVIITAAVAAGGNGTVTGVMELMANMFDQKKINPRGYLRAREHYVYTVVNSAVQTVDLPTDKVLKMIMFQGNQNLISLLQTINRIKISEDNDKHIFTDNQVSDLLRNLGGELTPIVEQCYSAQGVAATTHFVSPYYMTMGVLGGTDAVLNYGEVTDLGGGNVRLDAIAVGNTKTIVSGYAPHGCIGISFGDEWDIEDWYNPSGTKELKARLTAGAAGAGGTNKVIVQQLSSY